VSRSICGVRIEHVCGDPALSPAADAALQARILEAALKALETQVDSPRVFSEREATEV
jgi:hypothetical protein